MYQSRQTQLCCSNKQSPNFSGLNMLAQVSLLFMLSWRFCSAPWYLQAVIQAEVEHPAWSFCWLLWEEPGRATIYWLSRALPKGALVTCLPFIGQCKSVTTPTFKSQRRCPPTLYLEEEILEIFGGWHWSKYQRISGDWFQNTQTLVHVWNNWMSSFLQFQILMI